MSNQTIPTNANPTLTRRLSLVIGAAGACPQGGSVPASDRAAVGLAVVRFLESIPAGMAESMPSRDRSQHEQVPTDGDWEVEVCSFAGDDEALRYGLAAGAGKAVRLDDPRQIGFDVALVGEASIGAHGDLLSALLSEQRGAALLFDVLDVEPFQRGIRVLRDLGRGAREVLHVSGPAVLVISSDSPRLVYVSRHRWNSIERERIEIAPPVDSPSSRCLCPEDAARPCRIGLEFGPSDGRWESARPRTHGATQMRLNEQAHEREDEIFGLGAASSDDSSHIIEADARTCAESLLRYLAHYGFIARCSERHELADLTVSGAETSPSTSIEHPSRSAAEGNEVSAASIPKRERMPQPRRRAAPAGRRQPKPTGSAGSENSLEPSEV